MVEEEAPTCCCTTFYLIRHGEIDANVDRCWHGATDSDLNPTGVNQARRMAQRVSNLYPKISMIYVSPLKRTMKTAQLLAQACGKQSKVHPDLREYDIGELEGTSYEELAGRHQFFDAIARDQDFAPEGGESINQVKQRMLSALNDIASRHQGEQVAVVGHGAAIAIVLADLLRGLPYPFSDYHMANTGISQLKWGNSPELVSFNDTGHLQTGEITS